jgi:hypothetical protein
METDETEISTTVRIGDLKYGDENLRTRKPVDRYLKIYILG